MADRAVWQRTIVDERGNIIPGAEVTVRSYPGGSLVTLYENPEGAPKSNPFVTGHDGFARFWADSQRVEIVATGAGGSIRWIVDLLNADEVIGDAISEATAAAAVAVGEAEAAADRAEAARDAAVNMASGVYESTSAGLAATTDGDYFSVPSPDDDEYLILYRNDSGSAEEVQRYPSTKALETLRDPIPVALDWNVIDRSGFYVGSSTGGETIGSPDDDLAHLRLLHIQGVGGRGSQLAFDNSATVQRAWFRTASGAGWGDWGEIALQSAVESAIAEAEDEYQVMWSQMGHTAELSPFPPMQIGPRFVRLDTVSFDLIPLGGTWADTGLPWIPSGGYDEWTDLPASTIEVDGRQIAVTDWSFDLRPLRGYDAVTGAAWPAAGGAAVSSPELEVEVVSATMLHIYARQFGSTYVRWELKYQERPERNYFGWRIGQAHEVTRTGAGDYSVDQEITFDGETDVALRFLQSPGGSPKSNFNGGWTHGNEEMLYARILLNGVEIDPSETGVREVQSIELHQASEMFEVGDTEETTWDPKGDVVMRLYKYLRMEPDGWWRMRFYLQHVIGGFEADNTFFGMICLGWGTRGYDSVHTAARYPEWASEDVSQEGFTEIRTTSDHLKAWGDRYSGEVKMIAGWDASGRNVRVDSRNDRRKIYPSWYTGEITDTETPWAGEIHFGVFIKEND